MSKLRVYELAKELNVSSKDLIEVLMDEFNVEVKNHMSVIEEEDAELIKELLEGNEGKLEELTSKTIVDEYEDILNKEAGRIKKGKKKRKNDQLQEKQTLDVEVIEIGETITVKDLADQINKPVNEVIKTLMFLGVMAAMNQEIDFETAKKVAEKYEIEAYVKEEDS